MYSNHYLKYVSLLLLVCLLSTSILARFHHHDLINEKIEVATTFLNLLDTNEYQTAHKIFDKKMFSTIEQEKLQKTWQDLNIQAGSFQSILHSKIENQDAYTRTIFNVQFEHAVVDVIFMIDKNNKIAGLFFKPSSYIPEKLSRNEIVDTASSKIKIEKHVELGVKVSRLPMSHTSLKNNSKAPIVILNQNSGSSIRDETIDDLRSDAVLIKISKKINPEQIFVLGYCLGGILKKTLNLLN